MSDTNEIKQPETVVTTIEAVVKPLPRSEDYRSRIKKMSTRQLRGELKSIARNKEVTPLAGALATILLHVLDGTKITNPKAKLESYPR